MPGLCRGVAEVEVKGVRGGRPERTSEGWERVWFAGWAHCSAVKDL